MDMKSPLMSISPTRPPWVVIQLFVVICGILTTTSNSFVSHFVTKLDAHSTRTFVAITPFVAPMPPADLTPAIDKYTRLPEKEFYAQYKSLHNKSPLWMSSNSQSPEGPDPFSLVHDELKSLSDYVKEMVAAENPVLTMAASHFFQQVCSLTYVHFLFCRHSLCFQ